MLTSPPTTRPDLIGKTVVDIVDPYPHGDGAVPPQAFLLEIAVAEDAYTGVRILGDMRWKRACGESQGIVREFFEFELLEPGERLERYCPEACAWFGKPDFVYFQGEAREKWDREHRTPTGC